MYNVDSRSTAVRSVVMLARSGTYCESPLTSFLGRDMLKVVIKRFVINPLEMYRQKLNLKNYQEATILGGNRSDNAINKKFGTLFVLLISSSNIGQFSTFFHCQDRDEICNNTITKNPTISQVYRYTTL